MTTEQLETAILSDVVTRFVNVKESTSRRDLLIKFKKQAVPHVIANLLNQNMVRRRDPSTEEEYLPTAAAFQFCNNAQLRGMAKLALTVVLHTLQQMYVGERSKDGFVLPDLKRHAEAIYPGSDF
jgi:hypothetical protein